MKRNKYGIYHKRYYSLIEMLEDNGFKRQFKWQLFLTKVQAWLYKIKTLLIKNT